MSVESSGDGDELVECCPECESSSISSSQERRDERTWLCLNCRSYFPSPDQRPPRVGSDRINLLAEMDPDDLPIRGST